MKTPITISFSQIVWNARAFTAPPAIPRPQPLRHLYLQQAEESTVTHNTATVYEVLLSGSKQTICQVEVVESERAQFREFQNAILASRLAAR